MTEYANYHQKLCTLIFTFGQTIDMKTRLLLLLFGFILNNVHTQAAHLIGGKFSYKKIDDSTYFFQLAVEKECRKGASLENTCFVGLYSKSTNELVQMLNMPLKSRYESPRYYACDGINENCIEIGYYQTTLKVNSNLNQPQGYYLQWERCCLFPSFKNIVSAGANPFSALMEIPPFYKSGERINNSSPVQEIPFVPLVCLAEKLEYKLNYTDPDGDSLVYRLTTPLAGGYTSSSLPDQSTGPKPYDNVIWNTGYNEKYFIDVKNKAILNPVTGLLELTPTQLGFYLFAYAVDEYRDGLLLGTVIHQSYLNVGNCRSRFILQPTDQNVVPNSSVTLKVKHSDTLATYQWQIKKEYQTYFTMIPNETNDSLVLTNITEDMHKNQYRCFMRKPTCTDFSSIATLSILSTGISDHKNDKLTIYPNPSHSMVYLAEGNYAAIHLYSLNGVFIKTSELKNAVDISDLENGMYLLKVEYTEKGNTSYAKILKME